MPLTELASYVAKEKHLPDIPSAQEIKEQGVNLSDLQMQLLKKVEELTLYILKQERTIKELTRVKQQQEQTIIEQGKMTTELNRTLTEILVRFATLESRLTGEVPLHETRRHMALQ